MKLLKHPKLNEELEFLPIAVDGEKRYVNYFGGVQAGFPSPAEDFLGKRISLDEKYLSKPTCTFVIKVRGNSMVPTLLPGDVMIVRSDVELQDNALAIVSINHTDYTVKRYDKAARAFVPDNASYPSITVEESDVVMCLGVVRHVIRDL
jgi:DNA polymerase V